MHVTSPTRGLVLAARLAILAAGAGAHPPAGAETAPSGFVVENAFPAAHFVKPVELVFLPDGRKLVAQQNGLVWTVTRAGNPVPFIDLRSKVLGYSGLGLLGLAADPDFATNRWVYFLYTADPDSNGVDVEDDAFSRLERYRASTADSNVADLSTRQILIGGTWSTGIPSPHTSHTIGSLIFAPDKTLLIASGDGDHFETVDIGGQDPGQFGAGKTDPAEDLGAFRSQTLNTMAGKILRVDKETGSGLPSNPYWNGDPSAARSRVWLYGLRNPFRFTVRPGTGASDPSLGQPGSLYIGDVGWNDYEEIDIAPSGGLNMGWPCFEGPTAQAAYQTAPQPPGVGCGSYGSPDNPTTPTDPPIWWHHANGSNSNPVGWTGDTSIGCSF